MNGTTSKKPTDLSIQEGLTIAILDGNTVVGHGLALLLHSVGYTTRLLKESSAENAGEQLEGVNVLLLTPDLSEKHKEAFKKAMRADSETAHIPVLTLSTALKEVLPDQTGLVPWPSRLEDVRRAIEAVLAPLPSGEG